MAGMLELEIVEIITETADSKTFVLAADQPVSYSPGQFLTFLFQKNGREIRRTYSISSSPEVGDILAITIKSMVNGEISAWWMQEAKPGDRLQALPPAGLFVLRWQEAPRDIFLMAAGSGITPIFSIIQSALIKEPQSRIILIYSNRSPDEAIFRDRLLQLQARYPKQLFIEWMYSSHKNLHKARLGTYNLQRIINTHLHFGIANALAFTCGPYNYMMMVQITCLTMGFQRQNVRKEIFDIAPPPATIKRYFDTNDRIISIYYNNNKYNINVPWQQTILDAALANGIQLPYSCKAGRCSACQCKVLAGKVWMHYNEVLTDADEAGGIALTCTGHPASDGVIISW